MTNLHPTALLGGAGRKRNLYAHVVEEFGNRIVSGDMKLGDSFPNEVLFGREFQVSRSVIWEVVKSLATKKLLKSRTHTGIRVLAPMHWNLLDVEVLGWRYSNMPRARFFRELFEIRSMIEPQAAALAAERASKKELSELRAAFDAMMKDPQLLAEAETQGLDIDPVSGSEIAELVNRVYGTPPDVLDLVRKINAAR